jgi:enamine deaminase RidA (YjgF/YER057c/UK114 family)
MEKEAVQPKNVAEPVFKAYFHAIKARGNHTLFIAGQVAIDPSGKVVGTRDIRAQTRQVFENLKAILQEAGGSLENVMKTNTYYSGHNNGNILFSDSLPSCDCILLGKTQSQGDF